MGRSGPFSILPAMFMYGVEPDDVIGISYRARAYRCVGLAYSPFFEFPGER